MQLVSSYRISGVPAICIIDPITGAVASCLSGPLNLLLSLTIPPCAELTSVEEKRKKNRLLL